MTFAKIIKEIKKQTQQLKIVVVGLDNAGKTTIIHKIFNKSVDSISSTFGYQTSLMSYKGTTIQVVDLGGQSLFRDYWDSYFDKADGLIFVYDLSSSKDQTILSNSYLQEFINTTDIPILLLGNKVDLVYDEPRVGPADVRVNHLKCNGLTGTNLEKGMDWLVGECKRRLNFEV